MSKKIGFELKGSFLNDHDFNKYLVKKASFSNLKSNLANCTMCDINDHKMRVKFVKKDTRQQYARIPKK